LRFQAGVGSYDLPRVKRGKKKLVMNVAQREAQGEKKESHFSSGSATTLGGMGRVFRGLLALISLRAPSRGGKNRTPRERKICPESSSPLERKKRPTRRARFVRLHSSSGSGEPPGFHEKYWGKGGKRTKHGGGSKRPLQRFMELGN